MPLPSIFCCPTSCAQDETVFLKRFRLCLIDKVFFLTSSSGVGAIFVSLCAKCLAVICLSDTVSCCEPVVLKLDLDMAPSKNSVFSIKLRWKYRMVRIRSFFGTEEMLLCKCYLYTLYKLDANYVHQVFP